MIGSDVMDLYLGELAPARIGEEIVTRLESEGCLKPEAYRKRLESNGGYQTIAVLSDWIAPDIAAGRSVPRYVHVHPARAAQAPCVFELTS